MTVRSRCCCCHLSLPWQQAVEPQPMHLWMRKLSKHGLPFAPKSQAMPINLQSDSRNCSNCSMIDCNSMNGQRYLSHQYLERALHCRLRQLHAALPQVPQQLLGIAVLPHLPLRQVWRIASTCGTQLSSRTGYGRPSTSDPSPNTPLEKHPRCSPGYRRHHGTQDCVQSLQEGMNQNWRAAQLHSAACWSFSRLPQ